MSRALSDACGLAVLLLVAGAWMLPMHAAEPQGGVVSDQEIEKALAPAPRTRGITRGITVTTREDAKEEVRNEAAARPESIDLRIPFELNSSQLQPGAMAQLRQLELALQSPALRGSRFMIAGHTDATGNAEYNRQLSTRRAEAVRQFLVAAGIDAMRLETAGLGADQLLTPDRPADPANRRVEIRNIGEVP